MTLSLCDKFCQLLPCCPLPFFSNGTKKHDENGQVPYDYEYTTEKPEKEEDFRRAFDAVADSEGRIDAQKLQQILNETFRNDIPGFLGFGKDVCRGMIATMDTDLSGTLDYEEAREIRADILRWRTGFQKMDIDENGFFYGHEFQSLLKHLGIRLSPATTAALMMRYSDKYGHVRFEDFISCMVKLTSLLESFEQQQSESGETASFTMDQFLQTTVYC